MIQSKVAYNDYRPKDIYRQVINTSSLQSVEDAAYLVSQLKNSDRKALETFIKENIHLVVCIAKRFKNQGLTHHDLIIKGNLGLLIAVEYFDETKGFKFTSYAIWCIRQSIIQAIAECINTKPIPLNQIGLIRKVNITYIKLEQYFQLEPGAAEIAGMLEFQKTILLDALHESINKTGILV